jgi:hypothetical protein
MVMLIQRSVSHLETDPPACRPHSWSVRCYSTQHARALTHTAQRGVFESPLCALSCAAGCDAALQCTGPLTLSAPCGYAVRLYCSTTTTQHPVDLTIPPRICQRVYPIPPLRSSPVRVLPLQQLPRNCASTRTVISSTAMARSVNPSQHQCACDACVLDRSHA